MNTGSAYNFKRQLLIKAKFSGSLEWFLYTGEWSLYTGMTGH